MAVTPPATPDPELRILILEDVPADAELVELELKRAGIVFSSMRVETREDFMKGLDEFLPDLILADQNLPHFDGLSGLEIVKERRPDVPFIFVTGAMGEEWTVETLRNGARDYVLKERLFRLVPAVKRALKDIEEEKKILSLENELRQRLDEVERFNKLMVGRELRMEELRKENEALKARLGELEKKHG